jgi:uncharacterized protein
MEEQWKSVPEHPQFVDLSLSDKPLLDAAFAQFPPIISEFTFTNLFIWRQQYRVKMTRIDGFLCLLSDQGEKSFFFPAMGEGNVVECYKVLFQDLKERGALPKIARVPEEVVLPNDWTAAGMVAQLDRNQCDYVYLVNDLARLEGRKYHRKRNHIKQFKGKYTYEYTALTPEWIPECLRLQSDWCDLRHCDDVPGLANEFVAIKEAFAHFETLKVTGGAILIDGKLEAFAFGEPLNRDTVVIHIEKANPAFDGLYPMINQAFLEHHWTSYTYVNREQDLGEEGLRKAKESYFPHHLVNKYTITLR